MLQQLRRTGEILEVGDEAHQESATAYGAGAFRSFFGVPLATDGDALRRIVGIRNQIIDLLPDTGQVLVREQTLNDKETLLVVAVFHVRCERRHGCRHVR